MEKIPFLILIIINLPLFGGLSSILLGKDGIWGAIKYLFIPDLLSAVRGEFWDDKWSELMFLIWISLCAVLVWWEYNYIETNFPALLSYFTPVTSE